MSADRFEIHDHGSKLTVRDTKYGSEVSMLRVRGYSRELTVMAGAIRQQARDIADLKDTLADEVTANEAFRKAGGARDDEDMPTFCARLLSDLASMTKARDELGAHLDQFIAERDQLRARLAAVYSAPTVAFIGIDRKGVARATYFPDPHPSHAMMDLDAKFSKWAIQELITRPAKDGGM